MSKDTDISSLKHDTEIMQRLSGFKVVSVSANYTITDVDKIKRLMVTTGSSTITITLPDMALNIFRELEIIKADEGTGTITIARAGTDSIYTPVVSTVKTSLSVAYQKHGYRLFSDGNGWEALGIPNGVVSYKYEALATTTDLDNVVTTLLSFTIPKSGIYKVDAELTYSNGRDVGVEAFGMNSLLYKDSTILIRSNESSFASSTGDTTYGASSLQWIGVLLKNQVLHFKALVSPDNVGVVYGQDIGADYTHWTITQLGQVEAL